MTRVCSKCGLEKPLEEFPRRWDRPLGRGTICLACGRAYRKTHYELNREYYLEKAHRGRIEQRARAIEQLIEYLRSHPCVDCGETDIRVLHFDHIDPALKTTEVSNLIRIGTWSRALKEIEKCEVRCGNCHRRKTLREIRARGGGFAEPPGPWSWSARAVELVWAVSSVDRAPTF